MECGSKRIGWKWSQIIIKLFLNSLHEFLLVIIMKKKARVRTAFSLTSKSFVSVFTKSRFYSFFYMNAFISFLFFRCDNLFLFTIFRLKHEWPNKIRHVSISCIKSKYGVLHCFRHLQYYCQHICMAKLTLTVLWNASRTFTFQKIQIDMKLNWWLRKPNHINYIIFGGQSVAILWLKFIFFSVKFDQRCGWKLKIKKGNANIAVEMRQ